MAVLIKLVFGLTILSLLGPLNAAPVGYKPFNPNCTPMSDAVKKDIFEVLKEVTGSNDKDTQNKLKSIQTLLASEAIVRGKTIDGDENCPYHLILTDIILDTANSLWNDDVGHELAIPVGQDKTKTDSQKKLLRQISRMLSKKLELPGGDINSFWDGTDDDVQERKDAAKMLSEQMVKLLILKEHQ